MKKIIVIGFLMFGQISLAADFDYPTFVKRCGWGTLWGAGLGLVTLGFENHPFDHFNNVAKGASLGLYGGILYGLTVPVEYSKVQFNNAPVESTQLYFDLDWYTKKTQVLWVYRF